MSWIFSIGTALPFTSLIITAYPAHFPRHPFTRIRLHTTNINYTSTGIQQTSINIHKSIFNLGAPTTLELENLPESHYAKQYVAHHTAALRFTNPANFRFLNVTGETTKITLTCNRILAGELNILTSLQIAKVPNHSPTQHRARFQY